MNKPSYEIRLVRTKLRSTYCIENPFVEPTGPALQISLTQNKIDKTDEDIAILKHLSSPVLAIDSSILLRR